MNDFLGATDYIDVNNPLIQATVSDVTKHASTPTEKAVLIHNFVRDSILFGWTGDFYDMKASEVLTSKIGYCNTKSTLFVAMLRAAGIPARQHFVDINAGILRGLIDPQTIFVDHSYTEVFLDNRWIKVDSYIVDKKLFVKAKAQLAKDGKLIGYGVHAEGSSEWDGKHDSFVQFLNNDSIKNLSSSNYGVYADVKEFYEQAENTWNKKNIIFNIFFRIAVNSANTNIEAIRKL